MAGAGERARLFHTIVVMGLSFGAGACGSTGATSPEAGGTHDGGDQSDGSLAKADAAGRSDAAGIDGPWADAPAPDAGDAGDAGDAAWGYENDAGICVCPPPRQAFPCCPPAYGACTPWPCYV